jgi:Fe2+ transport system protein A
MMPLSMAGMGEINTIKSLHGKEETIRFIESLGFAVGSEVSIVSKLGGNVIVSVKGSRVALSRSMASQIHI